MATIRQDAHLLKENVEAVDVRSNKLRTAGGDSTATPKRAFAIHSDTAKTTGSSKKGLQDAAPPPQKRRALGDISNRHRNRHDDGADNNAVARPKKSLKSARKSEVRVKKALAPRSKQAPSAPTTSERVLDAEATAAPADDVEDIEHAYGGLSSVSSTLDANYLASLRDEIARDLVENKTKSFMDDYDPLDALSAWDNDNDARALLESGAAPSPWWSQPTTDGDATLALDSATTNDPLWDDDVPPPDELADPLYDEHDDALDALLNADLAAACQQ